MYHLFAGAGYYPMSGLGDYIAPFETEDEAVNTGKALTDYNPEKPYSGHDWYSVITEQNGRFVEVSAGYKSNG